MRERKLFIGQKIRQLREAHSLTQAEFAQKISISTSYLNQMENNQRHVTASVLLSLAEVFKIDIVALSDNDSDRLLADLLEAMADPFFKDQMPSTRDLKQFTQITPTIARSFLNLHQALRRAGERMAEMDGTLERSGALNDPTPFEEVRDFFHYNNNYIDVLDRAAEALATRLSQNPDDLHQSLIAYLKDSWNIKVVVTDDLKGADAMRRFSAASGVLSVSNLQPRSSQSFQLAHQIAQIEHGADIAKIAAAANFKSHDAEEICKIGLANYFAGASILPYNDFLNFTRHARYDLQIIAHHFGASLEQVAHRLSTMQRAGEKGIPFFFARVDQAGNITKRHSATKLQFARFGSACPLWNVHAAFAS
ncbi:MAG: short-chain fatty acyl-CoA regulator family protein, partial [Pseudomonadota bacterium]